MATAAYAVLDPETGGLVLASAGHLPPLVVGGGSRRILKVKASPPLGAFPYLSWPEQEESLAEGETLLLYTDGLVERAGTPLNASIDELLSVTAAASGADEACQLAVEHVMPFGRDDVALVAVHYAALPAKLNLRLPADPPALADVRRILRRWLHTQSVGEADTREIVLAVSEACANAIEHAYSPAPAEFEVRREPGQRRAAIRGRRQRHLARAAGRESRTGPDRDPGGHGRARDQLLRARHGGSDATTGAAMNLADVEITIEDSVVIARLTGEIDLSNARGIEEAIAASTPNHAVTLVVNLSELEFIDSAGIQLLYQLRERLHTRGQEMRLVIPADSPAADALTLAGVMEHLNASETVQGSRRSDKQLADTG